MAIVFTSIVNIPGLAVRLSLRDAVRRNVKDLTAAVSLSQRPHRAREARARLLIHVAPGSASHHSAPYLSAAPVPYRSHELAGPIISHSLPFSHVKRHTRVCFTSACVYTLWLSIRRSVTYRPRGLRCIHDCVVCVPCCRPATFKPKIIGGRPSPIGLLLKRGGIPYTFSQQLSNGADQRGLLGLCSAPAQACLD